MSMKADLLNPELGYYDQGFNFTSSKTYEDVIKKFGKAKKFHNLAYTSRVFMELENEKMWTRGWIPIGLTQQIPSLCDLLPYTLGFHGVHAQREHDDAIEVRLNFHQHGGCRFVPEQCRTGAQTKCSIHSCNYTRDSDVMFGENGNNSDLMYKFVGINPAKLKPVDFNLLGSLITVNLDPSYTSFNKSFDKKIIDDFDHLNSYNKIFKHKWLDCNSNWKFFFDRFFNYFNDFTSHVKYCFFDEDETCEPYIKKKLNISDDFLNKGNDAEITWLFPNLFFLKSKGYCIVVIVQATAMDKNLQRCFFLKDDTISEEKGNIIFDDFIKNLSKINLRSKTLHQEITSSKLVNDLSGVTIEDSLDTHYLNKKLVEKFLKEHTYYRNAPIMDAGFLGTKRM